MLYYNFVLKFWIFTEANILNNVLSLPAQCVYRNEVWPCKLSFSCWLQGGKNAAGCGSNKWFFSCCVTEENVSSPENAFLSNFRIETKNILNIATNNVIKRKIKLGLSLKVSHRCGKAKTFRNTLQKRIIGGRPAMFAEYPWQAHIRVSEYQCGGVLISNEFVATAAHCIQQVKLQDIIVYLGELDTQDMGLIYEPLPVEKHNVTEKIVHPYFQFRMTQPDRYDVALLKLDKATHF
ncbi:serine protease 40-like, partial [Teleopsis dalmanni]|uniref:serine protease 40-like n=1 Tax=Teleopsis dalmanni TaxID=139649 RepID=UPI0018CF6FE1